MVGWKKDLDQNEGHICEFKSTLLFRLSSNSSSREEHVQILESRLRAVEDRLAGDQGPERSQQTSFPANAVNNRPTTSHSEGAPMNMYEGDSSFTSQSVQAQELAKTMVTSSGAEMRSNVGGTFDSLEGLLQPASKTYRSSEKDSSRPTVATSLPLPADMVLAMLKTFRGMSHLHFIVLISLVFDYRVIPSFTKISSAKTNVPVVIPDERPILGGAPLPAGLLFNSCYNPRGSCSHAWNPLLHNEGICCYERSSLPKI